MTLGVAVAGCIDAVPPPALNAVRDSAGVRIVESLSDSRYVAPWVLGQEPIWSVGEVEGDPHYLLDRVAGAMQLPNGDVLVANGGTNELRFYRSDGSFIKAEGRDGQGPGEFEYLRALGQCRKDGFVAFDLNWQMNEYTWEGDFVEKTIFRAPEGVTPYALACDVDSHVVLLGWGQAAAETPPVGFYQARDRLLLTNRRGEIALDFGERLVSERIGSEYGSRPHPAGRATVFALHDERLFVGSGERFEVEIRGLDDSLISLLRGPDLDLTVTDDVKSAYLENRLGSIPEERHPALRREVAAWEWPTSLPAFVELRVDVEGVLWLRAYHANSTLPQVWSLIDPAVGYMGDVRLPPRHELLEVGTDYVLARSSDDLDVQRVAKLPLDRRSGG